MYAGKARPCAFHSGGHVGVRRLNVFVLNLFVSSSRIDVGPGDTTICSLNTKFSKYKLVTVRM